MIVPICGVHELRVLMDAVAFCYVAGLPAVTCVVNTAIVQGAGSPSVLYVDFVALTTCGVVPQDGVAEGQGAAGVGGDGAAVICAVGAEGAAA